MSDVYLCTMLDIGGRATAIGGVFAVVGMVTSRSCNCVQIFESGLIVFLFHGCRISDDREACTGKFKE